MRSSYCSTTLPTGRSSTVSMGSGADSSSVRSPPEGSQIITPGTSGAACSVADESHMLFCVPLNKFFHHPVSPCAKTEAFAPSTSKHTVQNALFLRLEKRQLAIIRTNLMRAFGAFMPFCLKKVKISRAPETTGFHTKSTRYERRMIPDNSRRGDWFISTPFYGINCVILRAKKRDFPCNAKI